MAGELLSFIYWPPMIFDVNGSKSSRNCHKYTAIAVITQIHNR